MKYKGNEKEYMKHYRETHRKEFNAYSKKYYNKPGVKEHYKQYRIDNPFVMKEEWKIAKKAWADKNKERRYAEYKEYRKVNMLRMRARDQRRIAREYNAEGVLTVELLQIVYEDNIKKYGTLTCYLCLNPIKFKEDHLEHKIPLSRGGSNLYDNLAVSCKKCNLRKCSKTEEEYRSYVNALSVSA